VRIITTVPGPGAATCALAVDGPNYAFAETSLSVPSGMDRVVVKYVITDGGTGSMNTNASSTVFDQTVDVSPERNGQ